MESHFNQGIVMTKQCFKCGETKSLEDFYKHPRMADGHLNKCKECNKKDVSANYRSNREYYIEYEQKREATEDRKAQKLRYQRARRIRDPQKNYARNAVDNAVRDGKLAPEPCEVCGVASAQAHHDDYSKPLDVRWLCRLHHLAEHGKIAYSQTA